MKFSMTAIENHQGRGSYNLSKPKSETENANLDNFTLEHATKSTELIEFVLLRIHLREFTEEIAHKKRSMHRTSISK